MKNISIIALFMLTGSLLGADAPHLKTHSTAHYLCYYTQDLKEAEQFRADLKALCSIYQNEEATPAWIALDVIKKYQLPGYEVVPQLPARNLLSWTISDSQLALVIRHIVTEETMPLILARRQTSAWYSFVGWAADHIPSIAASARQSQLDVLRSEILAEYQSPCAAAIAQRSGTYKKTDGDDLLPLLPEPKQ